MANKCDWREYIRISACDMLIWGITEVDRMRLTRMFDVPLTVVIIALLIVVVKGG